MSLFIDVKYIGLVSSHIPRIVKKNDYLWNLRCPICGDSKKNLHKMRGYIFRKTNDLFYRCHNCGIGLTFGNFLKSLDESLYKRYVLERFSQGESGRSNFKAPTFEFKPIRFDKISKNIDYENAQRLSDLSSEHYCVKYAKSRKIPEKFYSDLFFTPKLNSFVKEIFPENQKDLVEDDRLVIPIRDRYNQIIGISSRSLSSEQNKLRYIALNFTDSKIYFSKSEINTSEPVRIVEGAIDSFFVNNCVAACSSALSETAELIDANQKILIFDNEPRNNQIVNLIEKAINKSHSVVIWPKQIIGKDINEMILKGLTIEELDDMIKTNSFSGLEAKLKFASWRKC